MTASCAPFVRLLSARIDGALEGPFAAQLEEHLAACDSCRAREFSLLAQGEALRAGSARRLEQLEKSGAIDLSNFSARVLRAVERDQRRPSRWERFVASIRERWEHQRLAFSASLGFGAAGIAALALVLATPRALPIPSALNGPQEATALASQASIDNLEILPGATGAVFEVPGQTTVIWVSDEAAE